MQQIVGIVVALLIGAMGGFYFGQNTMQTSNDTHSHEEGITGHAADGHSHDTLVEAPDPAPTLSVVVHEDPKDGVNVELITENFTFAPQDASTEHVPGEGHAHIYVDGEKINRVYGNWYHLGGLTPGEHEIRVELSTNDHGVYAVDGEVIEVVKSIVIPEKEKDDHADDHSEGEAH